MAKNHALKMTELADFLMSEGEVAKSSISREQLFEIKDTHETFIGFAKASDLKEYIYNNEEALTGFMVRNVDQSSWITVFEHPLFQRRKPQLVPANTLASDDDQQFFVLIHGQKTGPFEKFEMSTQTESWDEKNFFMQQKFIRKGEVVAEGYIKARFKQRGRKGSVPTAEIFKIAGHPYEGAKLSEIAKAQNAIDEVLVK